MSFRKQKGASGVDDVATDEAVHRTALAIARRCVFIIRACLREEEWIDATREFYQVAKTEIEKWKTSTNG